MCGEVKPIVEFYVDKSHKNGRGSRCKPCHLVKCREYYRAHLDEKLAYAKRYRNTPEGKARIAAYNKANWMANREARTLQQRRHYADPEIKRRRRMYEAKRNYGLSEEEYDAMLVSQGGVCAICGTDSPIGKGGLHIDHDHVTGKVRGLLCQRCNIGVGFLGDSEEIITKTLGYLRRSRE